MKRFILTLTCMMALLLFATLAPAQKMGPGMGYGNMGPGNMGPGSMGPGMGYGGGMWNNYQITPEQQQAYRDISEKYQIQFAKLSEQTWSKRAQLNAVLAQEKIDTKQAKALAAEIGGLMAQSYALRVDMLIDMRERGLSYYGLDMMHGGGMGYGMMDMMHGGGMGYGMMNMMHGGGWYPGGRPGYDDARPQ